MPRIAFLFNYPLADNTPWKQELIRALDGGHELLVVFGKTHPIDYVRTYLRKRQEDTVADVPLPPSGAQRTRTMAVLKELGIPARQVRSVNDDACARILGEFRPDYVVTALDHLLSRRIIDSVPAVLNVHYGVLPEVKGWNATEWSLLETGRLSVSLHKVVWPVDSGEIFITRDVEVGPTDGMASLREKCQAVAVELYAEFFRDPAKYEQSARSGAEGKTYYVMNRLLKQRVLEGIGEGRFAPPRSHRQDPAASAQAVRLASASHGPREPAEKPELLGLTFDAVTMDDAVARCLELCRAPRSSHVIMTINASHLCMMRHDPQLAAACRAGHLTVADGMSVVWALRASGQPAPERVAGVDLMARLLAAADENHLRVYFLGAKPEVVKTLVDRCRARHPGLEIAGFRDGYFGPDDHAAIVEEIRASGAHMLFVGMPSPFKEVWCERHRQRLQVPVIMGVGGSFDVLAGYIKRAPGWAQSMGLEWFWRLLMEPRKLWKRYLTTNSEFIWRAGQEIVARRLSRSPVTQGHK
jgi:N-acetylglucosaminyldiphosphoundecaprenol N-acetyl-beta-D-mannosaminyltransferase